MRTNLALIFFKNFWARLKGPLYGYIFLSMFQVLLICVIYIPASLYLSFHPESKIFSKMLSRGFFSFWGLIVCTLICISAFKSGKIYKHNLLQESMAQSVLFYFFSSITALVTLFTLTGINQKAEMVVFIVLVNVLLIYGKNSSKSA